MVEESFTPGPDRVRDLLRSVIKLFKLGREMCNMLHELLVVQLHCPVG